MRNDLNHYPQTTLRWVGDEGFMANSQVLLCRQAPAHQAVVFIHGFGGDAGNTWEFFPQAIATMSEASKADVFFLQYPSTTTQVAFCAALLRGYLRDLVRDPVYSILEDSLPGSASARNQDERYRRILIVAHSMGAVIARRALLDLERLSTGPFSDDELSKFRLLFFAPAHSGSTLPLLIASGLGLDFPGAKLMGQFAKIWFQSLRDLEQGSPALAKLADDCQRIRTQRIGRGGLIEHLRARVYHALNDRVVSQNDFDDDPPFEPIMNQNHRSICKPVAMLYAHPIEALRALLAEGDQSANNS